MLLPKLFSDGLGGFRKLSKLWIEVAGLCQQATEVVGFDQFPTVMDQIGLQEAFRSFVKELDPRP